MNSKKRCKWCNLKNPLYIAYHDEEWCRWNPDEHYLYEMLILESFQAGLSWECVLNKRENFRIAYDGFDIDKNGEYHYDEKKVSGYNPTNNKKAEIYPVPVKFWHCIDDEIVSYEVTKDFVDNIKNNGGIAYLRTFPYGGHEPQLVGENVKKPSGNNILNKNEIEIIDKKVVLRQL